MAGEGCVFLDRDGVINQRLEGYVTCWEDFIFLPRVKEALAKLHQQDWDVVIVSNQAGMSRGLLTERALSDITDRMVHDIEAAGGEILGVYYCPEYDASCFQRKPNPGMLLDAAEDYDIDLQASWMVGDTEGDIEAGRRVGARTVLVSPEKMTKSTHRAHYVVKDLYEAALLILKEMM